MAGIYIHVPFCKSRCTYCDFYSTVGAPSMERYVDAVIAEARMRMGELHGEPVRTLYLGGGTPSQLPMSLMQRLLDTVTDAQNDLEEVTVEVNPDDVSAAYIEALAVHGVNRVSMGIQSLVDDELRRVGRRHTARQAVEAVNAIRQGGIRNVSVDLIFGLPGQSLHTWRYSLEQMLTMQPEHLSAYGLSFEPGTVLWKQRERGEVDELDEETSLQMYAILLDMTRKVGYEHYEISNFALPGRRSRHNSAYWVGTPYLGFGASAHSFDGRVRRYNPADIKSYMTAIEQGTLPAVTEALQPHERYDEQVMVSLRTCEGVNTLSVKETFGQKAFDHLLAAAGPHLAAGRLRRDGDRLILTRDGIMTSDAIIRDLMW